MTTALVIFFLGAVAFAVGFWLAARHARAVLDAERARLAEVTPARPLPAPRPTSFVRFASGAARGTRGPVYDDHDVPWRDAMREIGKRLEDAQVDAIVFVHGTFTGDDPLSTSTLIERAFGATLARAFKKTTRTTALRLLGDLGVFGPEYVNLFERALGGTIPCTTFVWSSENHHVGRASGGLSLVRTLAMHCALVDHRRPRLLVVGHSHAAQLFAIVTQLVARASSAEAFADVARVRGLDVGALDIELDLLARADIDFVTLGAPSRYAWAEVPGFRALHLLNTRLAGGVAAGDLVAKIGAVASDFPPLDGEERRVNATLGTHLASRASRPYGEVVHVDYDAVGAAQLFTTGFGHGMYTRFDAMLFHAELIAARLYGGRSPEVRGPALSFAQEPRGGAQETTRSERPRKTSLWLPVR